MKWWLSFADGDGFRGAVVVEAADFPTAVERSHAVGCNPGGECKGWPLPAEADGEYDLDRLYGKTELEAMGEMTEAQAEAKGLQLASPGELLCEEHNRRP